jgi:nitrite reductase/ring-hydroxylating ferredoxin subunit
MTEYDETATPSTPHREPGAASRRTLLRGAAVGGVAVPFLAACGGEASDAGGGSSPDAAESSGAAGGGADAGGGGGGVSVKASEVPVGGGKILADERVVVTQPTKGEFKAFTAVCTHQKCVLSEFVDDRIKCKCHGSEFSLATGENVAGPNGSEAGSVGDLAAKKVSVAGGQISVT